MNPTFHCLFDFYIISEITCVSIFELENCQIGLAAFSRFVLLNMRLADFVKFSPHGSLLFEYKADEDWYESGNLHAGRGTKNKLVVKEGTLTPPESTPWGQDVTLTMEVDYDTAKNELLFTFGPHGCRFSQPARVVMDYAKLGIDVVCLYYIDEDGTYIPQPPVTFDKKGKKMTIFIDHFSRYAIGME
jgi:hypothetical protein